jgi:hypothetical protein
MPGNEFLGAGMKFPPQVNKATGRFVVSSEKESVKESVYLILMTQKTERFLRPDFGSNLMSYTFMDVNVTSVNMMVRSLTEQILMQEPRVKNVVITTDSQTRDGCLIVNIDYTIRSSNIRDNLVFPFYLNASAEEEAYEPEQYEPEELE